MMVLTITLLGTLNFYLLFKFNIYKKSYNTNIIYNGTYIIFDGINLIGIILTKKSVNINPKNLLYNKPQNEMWLDLL